MAAYDIHLMLVSLNISDEPVGYAPPIGPAVRFRATYNQREIYQPQTFSYSNLGPKWTFDWLSYIEEGATPDDIINLYVRGGGQETYVYDSTTGSYGPHKESRAGVIRTSPDRYERHLSDGSVEVFAKLDGALPSRKVFMTEVRDPQGNATTFMYDPTGVLRVLEIHDAAGGVTTLSYDWPGDDLKITKFTDPFGRFATFNYVDGRLDKITDVLTIQSSFEYDTVPGSVDFIKKLTTPYGITSFQSGEYDAGGPRSRWLEVTDPLGGKERVEYYSHPGVPPNFPDHEAVVPPDFALSNGSCLWSGGKVLKASSSGAVVVKHDCARLPAGSGG